MSQSPGAMLFPQRPAIEFLQHLDPSENATFNIEHYTDLPKGLVKPKFDRLSGRYANLTTSQITEKLPELQAINDKGAGIFIAVNRFNGHREIKNLSRVRGIHADMDDVTEGQLAEHITMAKEVCARMHETALIVFQQDQEKGKRLLQDAKASHHMPRLTAMLKLAVSEKEMAATDRELDCDPYLLGVANGVVNLRDGQFLINKPSLKITRYCNANFDIDASCTRWIPPPITEAGRYNDDTAQRSMFSSSLGRRAAQ